MNEQIQFCRLPLSFTEELIRFVVKENYQHYGIRKSPEEREAEIAVLCEEEAQYNDSYIFAATSGHRLCGTIRICRKLPGQALALEKMYGLDIKALTGERSTIYHIGRFAVSKGTDRYGIRIFRTLMALALNIADQDHEGTVFAECDSRLLRTVRHLGIEAQIIGEPVLWLGSETVSVQMSRESYQKFLSKNKALLLDEKQL